jgi:hypothetical protein
LAGIPHSCFSQKDKVLQECHADVINTILSYVLGNFMPFEYNVTLWLCCLAQAISGADLGLGRKFRKWTLRHKGISDERSRRPEPFPEGIARFFL